MDENSNQKRVLIVEDDKQLNYINSRALKTAGYAVDTALTLAGAREILKTNVPDIILLDVKLPDGNGVDFCKEIRASVSSHIIFLTSVTDYDVELNGLLSGGDDYLRKPYGIELLRARVAKGIQRNATDPEKVQMITKGPLTLNLAISQAMINGADMLLTHKEFSLLFVLAQNEGKAMQADVLYEKAWNQPMLGDNAAIKVTVSRLRKKLENTEYGITAVRGQGYCFKRI